MGTPVESDRSATATEMVSTSPECSSYSDKSTDSATISGGFANRVRTMAQFEERLRSILPPYIFSVKNDSRSTNGSSSVYTDSDLSFLSYDGTNRDLEVGLISEEAIHNLRSIAEQMIAAGLRNECVRAYSRVRKIGVEQELRKLEIEKLDVKYIQRLEFAAQNMEITRWIHAAKKCVRLVFAGERRLSEQIFKGLGTEIGDACFMETVGDFAADLFSFPEAISTSRKSPEKLFKMIDLHEVLSDLSPEIETIFRLKSGEFIRRKVAAILSGLSEAVREILTEFEKSVSGEISTSPIPDGSIHPLIRYVMNYIVLMADYKQTLNGLITLNPTRHTLTSKVDFDNFPEFEGVEQAPPLVLHVVWTIEILKFKLEGKSKQYRDASLAHFFMMNNLQFIVRKVEESIELREMIGDDYRSKLTSKSCIAAAKYRDSAWEKVLNCLRDESLQKLGNIGCLSNLVLRRRFKTFNAKFEDVLKTQGAWSLADAQLRDEVRISASEVLVPVYASFLDRYGRNIKRWKHPENYIKYSVQDLEKAIMAMFSE